MNVKVPGNARLVFNVDSVEIETPVVSIDPAVETVTIDYSWEIRGENYGAWLRGRAEIDKLELQRETAKPFGQINVHDLRAVLKDIIGKRIKARTDEIKSTP